MDSKFRRVYIWGTWLKHVTTHLTYTGFPLYDAASARPRPVFLNRRAADRYRPLASIIPGRERHEKTTICYKILLVQLVTKLNVILYLSTSHTVYISVLILFMIMP